MKDGNLALVDPGLFTALSENGGAYPGDAAGGETPKAVGRLMGTFGGAGPLTSPRRLSLTEISETHGQKQFDGDGTAADRRCTTGTSSRS